MKYKSGYNYQLVENESFQTSFRPAEEIVTDYITLSKAGLLTVFKGYAWDGVSGPVIDTDKNMHAGLCHDALYQLMRMGLLSWKLWREADAEFAVQMELYGACEIGTWVCMKGLEIAGGKYAHPDNKVKVEEILTA